MRYHNTCAFPTFNPSGKQCNFNFNPNFYAGMKQKQLLLFSLLNGLHKQSLDFDKKWLKLAARQFIGEKIWPFLVLSEKEKQQ